MDDIELTYPRYPKAKIEKKSIMGGWLYNDQDAVNRMPVNQKKELKICGTCFKPQGAEREVCALCGSDISNSYIWRI